MLLYSAGFDKDQAIYVIHLALIEINFNLILVRVNFILIRYSQSTPLTFCLTPTHAVFFSI